MMKRKEPRETTRYEAFLQMDAVISTLIQHDPPEWHLRQLPNAVILGFADALDAYQEAIQREWVRRAIAKGADASSLVEA